MKKFLTTAILAASTAVSATAGSHGAEHAVTYVFDGEFEDATFAVETAIVGKGLVIDYRSHTGEMLNRTGRDVGSDVTIWEEADIFVFCSAVTSREVMEIDPMNIAFCPYGIFVADDGEQVIVGYSKYPEGEMQKVQSLLDEIVQDALGN